MGAKLASYQGCLADCTIACLGLYTHNYVSPSNGHQVYTFLYFPANILPPIVCRICAGPSAMTNVACKFPREFQKVQGLKFGVREFS